MAIATPSKMLLEMVAYIGTELEHGELAVRCDQHHSEVKKIQHTVMLGVKLDEQ
jgi:hypothetical protein